MIDSYVSPTGKTFRLTYEKVSGESSELIVVAVTIHADPPSHFLPNRCQGYGVDEESAKNDGARVAIDLIEKNQI